MPLVITSATQESIFCMLHILTLAFALLAVPVSSAIVEPAPDQGVGVATNANQTHDPSANQGMFLTVKCPFSLQCSSVQYRILLAQLA